MYIANLMKAEFKRAFLGEFRYPLWYLGQIAGRFVVLATVFLGANYLGGTTSDSVLVTGALLNILVLILALESTNSVGTTIVSETRIGTIQQLFVSPISFPALLVIRDVAAFFAQFPAFVVQVLLLKLVFGVSLYVPLALILPVLFTMRLGMLGFGFLFGAGNIMFQRTNLLNILTNVLMLPTILVNEGNISGALRTVANLFPLTKADLVVQGVMLHGVETAYWEGLLRLMSSSAVFLFVGLAVFRVFLKMSLKRGLVGQY